MRSVLHILALKDRSISKKIPAGSVIRYRRMHGKEPIFDPNGKSAKVEEVSSRAID
jgi:hypothetical protein